MHEDELTYSQVALIEYLKELDFKLIPQIFKGEVSMRGNVATDGVIFDTIVSIPVNVPPSYPKFYLVDTGLELREAHVERPFKLSIGEEGKDVIVCRTCIRDEREKYYSTSPTDLLHHLYVDYLGLCSKIARKEFNSKEEIFREFDSYWCNEYSIFWYMQSEPSDGALIDQINVTYEVPLPSGRPAKISFAIVTDRPEEIIAFSANAGWKVERQRSVYFDIADSINLPLPYTYGDMFDLLEKANKIDHLKRVRKQILSRLIYLGINLSDTQKHYIGVGMKDIGVIGGRNTKRGKGNGDILTILFSTLHRNVPFTGSHIDSIEYNWLMQRGGSARQRELSFLKKRVAIIGCGSIGSSIAFKLSKGGISDFILVDPENLVPSNIGRHQLGMSFVGDGKARALSRYLSTQFIGMSVEYHIDCIESPGIIDKIRDTDLIITAIGSDAPAVEPWLADLACKGEIPRMIACWLEADGVAGHVLQIGHNEKIMFDDMCDRLNIIDSDYASTLLESEVGCNSTYMPYGYIDADTHIGRMAHYAISILQGNISRGITSTGDLSQHEKYLKTKIPSWSYTVFNDETLPI